MEFQRQTIRDRLVPIRSLLVGILPGEGSGPEVVRAASNVLRATTERFGVNLNLEVGGAGRNSTEQTGCYLTDKVVEFCADLFSAGGTILAGAVGGRFVYDMRRRFQLYYKLNPLRSYPELRDICRIKLPAKPVDVLVVRENLQGIYQGDTLELQSDSGREILHTFMQSERHIRAVLEKAMAIARERRNQLAVVGKCSGTPAIYALWQELALEASRASGVEVSFIDIDFAAYKLLHEPQSFDVLVAPNCFGDILSDLGGLLAGSRGLTFGASYSSEGASVYQTNHGAAHDRAGTDTANPVAQIFSVAMMLRETFGLAEPAQAIEDSVRSLWREGWRTPDLAESGCPIAGTRKFGELVAEKVERIGVQEAFAAGPRS